MDPTDSATSYSWRSPGVVADTVDGVTIAIDLDNGVYYQFSRDASCLLEALPHVDPRVLDEEVAGTSVRSFFDELQSVGLVEECALSEEVATLRAFCEDGLSFQSFTDLAHILMLDPIHDVDPPMGWPHTDAPAT